MTELFWDHMWSANAFAHAHIAGTKSIKNNKKKNTSGKWARNGLWTRNSKNSLAPETVYEVTRPRRD